MPGNWTQTEHLQDWFVSLIAETPESVRPGVGSVIILTIWELWLERNVFKKTIKMVQQIVHSIRDAVHNWTTVGNQDLELLTHQWLTLVPTI